MRRFQLILFFLLLATVLGLSINYVLMLKKHKITGEELELVTRWDRIESEIERKMRFQATSEEYREAQFQRMQRLKKEVEFEIDGFMQRESTVKLELSEPIVDDAERQGHELIGERVDPESAQEFSEDQDVDDGDGSGL